MLYKSSQNFFLLQRKALIEEIILFCPQQYHRRSCCPVFHILHGFRNRKIHPVQKFQAEHTKDGQGMLPGSPIAAFGSGNEPDCIVLTSIHNCLKRSLIPPAYHICRPLRLHTDSNGKDSKLFKVNIFNIFNIYNRSKAVAVLG